MPNLIPLPGFKKIIKKINPDVLHLHFVYQDMVSFNQLRDLGIPIVITLHDFLSINAADVQPGTDRRFIDGYSKENSSAIERWIFNRKAQVIHDTHPLYIAPSSWAQYELSASIIGKGMDSVVIPNLIGKDFKFDDNNRVKHDKFVLLFGAKGALTDINKGWKELCESLCHLPDVIKDNMEIKVFGAEHPDSTINGILCKFVGTVKTPKEMCLLHHAVDAFAFPSKLETQGMTKIEALLDGIPVITFKRSACHESIIHGENGWVADDGDVTSFANGIIFFYNKFISGELDKMHQIIASCAAEKFSEDHLIKETLAAYQSARLT